MQGCISVQPLQVKTVNLHQSPGTIGRCHTPLDRSTHYGVAESYTVMSVGEGLGMRNGKQFIASFPCARARHRLLPWARA